MAFWNSLTLLTRRLLGSKGLQLVSEHPFVSLIGVVSSVLGIYQFFAPEAYRISYEDLKKAESDRSACEKIASRGLECSGDGLVNALANGDHELIDLFLAAHITAATRTSINTSSAPVWSVALGDNLPGLLYLLRKDQPRRLESIPLACGTLNYPDQLCSPTIEIFQRDATGEAACRIIQQDPQIERVLASWSQDSAATSASRREDWSRFSDPRGCGDTSNIDPLDMMNMCQGAVMMGESAESCEARICAPRIAAFKSRYPTADAYVSAAAVDPRINAVRQCQISARAGHPNLASTKEPERVRRFEAS